MRTRRRPLAGRALKLSIMRAKSAPPPVTGVHPLRHERAISAPHRWSGAAERGELRPTRSDLLSASCPAGLRCTQAPANGATGGARRGHESDRVRHRGVARRAGRRALAPGGIPVRSKLTAANPAKPSPWPTHCNTPRPFRNRSQRPPRAPPPQRLGRAWHLPWRTLKIYPQRIGTQLSLETVELRRSPRPDHSGGLDGPMNGVTFRRGTNPLATRRPGRRASSRRATFNRAGHCSGGTTANLARRPSRRARHRPS